MNDSATPTTARGSSAGTDGNRERFAHIPGWGADLPREQRPAYPMERMPARLPHPPHGPPEQQRSSIEVLVSTERPRITRIFGTTLPPSGLSGSVRRYAFRHSENDLRHWMLLLLADRIQVGEALIGDLGRGHVPNLYAEMGGPAEMRHNPAGLARKVAIAGAAVLVLAYLNRRKPNRATGRNQRLGAGGRR